MLAEIEECNKTIVSNFYKAMAIEDSTTVHHLLAPHIDWWFHGPPACTSHLIRLLTGNTRTSDDCSFAFNPISVASFGSMVMAEGYDIRASHDKASWVHAWTVTDGVMTQVREYFNTSVTVTRFAKSGNVHMVSPRTATCQRVWQSKLTDSGSMPGLLLAL